MKKEDSARGFKRLPLTDIALGVLILVLAYLSPRFIPYNMDEFSHYHVLGCKHAPLSDAYDRFANGCDMYDLKLPGTSNYLPLRSYLYIGVAQTLPFIPVWALFDDPVAGRVLGALYLLLAAFLLSRLVGVGWKTGLFALVLFPSFAAPFLLDTGPVGISICLLLALMLLLRRAVRSELNREKISLGVLIGVVAFLAISIKLVFVWVMPALALWAVWIAWPQAQHPWLPTLQRQLPLIFAAAVVFLALSLTLLAAVDRSGAAFMSVSATSKVVSTPEQLFSQVYRLGKPFWNSAFFDLRTMTLPGNKLFDAIPLLIGLVVIAAGLWNKQPTGRKSVVLLLVLAGVTFAIITTNNNAWAPHHTVHAMVFVVAAMASCLGVLRWRRVVLALLITLSVLYWASLIVRLPLAVVQADTNFDKDNLVRFIRTSHLDESTVQVHVDWGTYYLSHTFGDSRQLALTVYDFSHESRDKRRADLQRIRDIAKEQKRDILMITRQPNRWRQDPDVVDLFGQPVTVYSFNTWAITRYRQ